MLTNPSSNNLNHFKLIKSMLRKTRYVANIAKEFIAYTYQHQTVPWKSVLNKSIRLRRLPSFRVGFLGQWLGECSNTADKAQFFNGCFKGKTIYCVGNGPSLLSQDLSLLNNQIVIGTNRAYKLLDQFEPSSFNLVIQDSTRLSEILPSLLEGNYGDQRLWISSHDSFKFPHPSHYLQDKLDDEHGCTKNHILTFWPLPSHLIYNADCHAFELRVDWPALGNSRDIFNGFFLGHSVIFSAIQLACFFGARNIVCIGIEMDYESNGASFDPSSKILVPTFSYTTRCRDMMINVRDDLKANGISLWNATPGGKVDELSRISLNASLDLERSTSK